MIDYDNSCKQITVSDDVEGAWYLAAMELAKFFELNEWMTMLAEMNITPEITVADTIYRI